MSSIQFRVLMVNKIQRFAQIHAFNFGQQVFEGLHLSWINFVLKWIFFFSLELLSSRDASLNNICSNDYLTPFPLGSISVFSSMKIYFYKWYKFSNSISCYLGSQHSCEISWFEYNLTTDQSLYTIFFSLHYFATDKIDESVFIIGYKL